MTWTTPADLRAQVQKLWDKGELLRPLMSSEPMAPLRLRLVGPNSTELAERFDAVRAWMRDLGACRAWGAESEKRPQRGQFLPDSQAHSPAMGQEGGEKSTAAAALQSATPKSDRLLGCHAPADRAPGYRIAMREFRHRVLGANAVPDAIWLDTLDAALALVGKKKDAQRFVQLVDCTRAQQPALLPWLHKRPLQALALAREWPRLLDVVAWLQAHPRPSVYLRQVDLPGVDSKFIEAHRSVLSALLDLALPEEAIDPSATGTSQFCRRYGFKDKPLRIRLRWLGDAAVLLPAAGEQDVALTQAGFERLALPVRRVFITENEVGFLAFPATADSLVIFGAGYGFDALAGARWLHACRVYYWGDIDTHGFAILDQLRAHLPQVQSLLMDRETLLAHTGQWGQEPMPVLRDLPRLDTKEHALFDDLRHRRLGDVPGTEHVRLEQERIGFGWVQRAVAALPSLDDITEVAA